MGDNKAALELIISELGDVEEAIEFAKDVNDDELWDELIQRSLSKPGARARADAGRSGRALTLRSVATRPQTLSAGCCTTRARTSTPSASSSSSLAA